MTVMDSFGGALSRSWVRSKRRQMSSVS